jgi:hypothetical protein
MVSVIRIMTDGKVEEDLLHGLHSPDFNPLDFYLWGHLTTPTYAAPVDNQEALHHCIVDACQTIRNYPGILERMRPSMMKCAKTCIESRRGYFEQILYVHSFSYNEYIYICPDTC